VESVLKKEKEGYGWKDLQKRKDSISHRYKNVLLRFLFWSRFLTFLTFFYFPNVFYLKYVGKVQSGKQINKKQ